VNKGEQLTPIHERRYERVLVTGSSTWTDRTVLRNALAEIWHPDTILVSGGCPQGAENLAEDCWRAWHGRVERHPEDWRQSGRKAVSLGADICLDFTDKPAPEVSRTATLAAAANIPVVTYRLSDLTGQPDVEQPPVDAAPAEQESERDEDLEPVSAPEPRTALAYLIASGIPPERAQQHLAAGRVHVDGQRITDPETLMSIAAKIVLKQPRTP
jgi:hypothetical protein